MTTQEDLDFVAWVDAQVAAHISSGDVCDRCLLHFERCDCPFDDSEPDYI